MTKQTTLANELGDGTIFLNPKDLGYDDILMKAKEALEVEPQTVAIILGRWEY